MRVAITLLIVGSVIDTPDAPAVTVYAFWRRGRDGRGCGIATDALNRSTRFFPNTTFESGPAATRLGPVADIITRSFLELSSCLPAKNSAGS